MNLRVRPSHVLGCACKSCLPQEKVAREFGSVDVFAAAREQTARLKEQRKLRLQEEQQDSWMPDKYYTDELKEVSLLLRIPRRVKEK